MPEAATSIAAPPSRRAPRRVGARTSFQAQVMPGPTERGHRPSAAFAAALLERALPLSEDPDMAAIWQLEPGADPEDEAATWMGFVREDIPDILGVPHAGWSAAEREVLADQALLAAVELRHGAPAWLAAAMLEDVFDRRSLRLVAVGRDDAAAFIADHHSKLPEINLRGLMYALGVVADRRLVAVATAGTPTGRWKDPHRVLELTRVASDGTTKGAASMLVARLIDLLPRSARDGAVGPALLVTYSLTTEQGTTYRALRDKGLRPVARIHGRGGGGARSGGSLADAPKIRWEAGPGAAPSRWDLVDGVSTADGIVDAATARLARRRRGERAAIYAYAAARRPELLRQAREARAA